MADEASPIIRPSNIPRVIGFSFRDYRANAVTKGRSAECMSCGRTVKEKAGTTSNFLRHLRKHHPHLYQLYQEGKQVGDVTAKAIAAELKSEKDPPQISTTTPSQTRKIIQKHPAPPKPANVLAKSTTAPPKKDDAIVELIVGMIIDESLPLNIGESEKFTNFLRRFRPKYKSVSEEAVSSEIARQRVELSSNISRRLSSASSVNVTINLWSDNVKRSFIAVTAHFLEDGPSGLKFTSSLLSCQRIVGVPNTHRLIASFTTILNSFHILEKLDYVTIADAEAVKIAQSLTFLRSDDVVTNLTLDNGEYLDDDTVWHPLTEKTRQNLTAESHKWARYSRLSCFSHTLSKCIDHILQTTECLRTPVAKVCCLVTTLQSNAEFQDLLKNDESSFKHLTQNTRKWDDTCYSVKVIISCDYEKLRDVAPYQLRLSLEEFELLKEWDMMIDPFLSAIKLTRYGMNHTVSAILPTVLALYKHLLNVRVMAQYLSDIATDLADGLYCNFKGVFANVGMTGSDDEAASMLEFGESVYMLAAVLDPTYGLHWLSDVHANEVAKSILKKRVLEDVLIEAESSACLESTLTDQRDDEGAPHSKTAKLVHDSKKGGIYEQASAQLEEYLDMVEQGCEGFTCFQFWTKYRTKLHILYTVARRVLAVPATEPVVERVFAYGGIVTKQRQAALNDRMLSDMLLLKVNREYEIYAGSGWQDTQ